MSGLLPSRRLALLALCSLTAATGAFAQANEVGDLVSKDATVRGAIMLVSSGTRVLSGSQITAGAEAAQLHLKRGGQVRICPRTNVSLSASGNGSSLLFSFETGAVEVHYSSVAITDSIVTPDFRIQLTGPGDFHLAVSVDNSGNTCVRTLAGDTAAAIVSEMLGRGSYQVSSGRAVVFRNGLLSNVGQPEDTCGCPAPEPVPEEKPSQVVSSMGLGPNSPASAQPSQEHLEVEAPFVFQGKTGQPDAFYEVGRITTRGNSSLDAILVPTVSPPEPQPQARTDGRKPGGFFRRIGGFFKKAFSR